MSLYSMSRNSYHCLAKLVIVLIEFFRIESTECIEFVENYF